MNRRDDDPAGDRSRESWRARVSFLFGFRLTFWSGDRDHEPWRARFGAELLAYRAEQEEVWGGIDELTLARYEAGVLPPGERERVEEALRDHPALRECLEIARELATESQAAGLPPGAARPDESPPDLFVFPAGGPVTIDLPRRPPPDRVLRRLAIAAAVGTIVVLGFAVRSGWRQPGPQAPPEDVERNSPPSKGPAALVVDHPKADIAKASDVKPSPPLAKRSDREGILARIATYAGKKPLKVGDEKVRELREEVVRYRVEYPEPKIPEMEAFAAASAPTPLNELLDAEARAEGLMGAPKEAAEVRELRNDILTLRLRDDTRSLVLRSQPLVTFMRSKETGDPAANASEMKTEVLALAGRLTPAKGRGPYLLGVLPPDVRDEAERLYGEVQAYARNPANPPDATLLDFLIRSRRPFAGDTVGVIIPTYDPSIYTIGTAVGNANWDRLIAAGNPDVPITAVVNMVINRDLLRAQGINGVQRDDTVFEYINRAKAKSITMLACLDCRPGLKTAESLSDEIDSWVGLYGDLDGFFLYNARLDALPTIYGYIRKKYGAAPLIVFSTPEFPHNDIINSKSNDNRFIVCAEQAGRSAQAFTPPDWVARYNPGRFAGVFRSTRADLAASIDLAATKHLGSVYLSDSGPQLPEYWPDELALIQRLNARIMGLGAGANPAVRRKKTANPKAK